jgi:hypothetical protein
MVFRKKPLRQPQKLLCTSWQFDRVLMVRIADT